MLPGRCVNALGWRLAERLVSTRYLMPLPEGLDPVPDTQGGYWVDLETLERHGLKPQGTEAIAQNEPEPVDEPEVEEAEPEFPKRLPGVGRYELSNLEVFKGSKVKAEAAEAALQTQS